MSCSSSKKQLTQVSHHELKIVPRARGPVAHVQLCYTICHTKHCFKQHTVCRTDSRGGPRPVSHFKSNGVDGADLANQNLGKNSRAQFVAVVDAHQDAARGHALLADNFSWLPGLHNSRMKTNVCQGNLIGDLYKHFWCGSLCAVPMAPRFYDHLARRPFCFFNVPSLKRKLDPRKQLDNDWPACGHFLCFTIFCTVHHAKTSKSTISHCSTGIVHGVKMVQTVHVNKKQ